MGISKEIYVGPFINILVPVDMEINDIISMLEVDKYYTNNSCGTFPKTEDEKYYELALMPNRKYSGLSRVFTLSNFEEPIVCDWDDELELDKDAEVRDFYRYCWEDLNLIDEKMGKCVRLSWGLVIYFN